MTQPSIRVLVLLLVLLPAGRTPAQQPQTANTTGGGMAWSLHAGDAWLMAGDSANGLRMEYLAAAAIARYPRGGFVIRRSIADGNTYTAAVDRLPTQTAQWKPSLLTVDLGTNDCATWYPHSLDFLTNPGSPLKAMLDSTREADERLFLISPSAWDSLPQGVDRPTLEEFLRKVHGFTVINNLPYLDEYAPAEAIQLPPGQRGADPSAQLLDAVILFKEMGADSLVSSVEIDAATGKLIQSQKAQVSDIHREGASLRFTRLDDSLPFPIPIAARSALDAAGTAAIGSPRDLFGMSRYGLTVRGLPPGRYRLTLDGQPVETITADELEKGYNAGLLDRGPIFDQEQQILTAVRAATATTQSDQAIHAAATPRPHIWSLTLVRKD